MARAGSLIEIVPEIDPESQRGIDAILSALPIQGAQALSFALNRTVGSGRTRAASLVSKHLGLRKDALTQPHRFGAIGSRSKGLAIDISRATPEKLEAKLQFRGKRIPISFFNPVASELTEQSPKRVFWRGKWQTFRRRGAGVFWTVGDYGRTFAADAFVGRARAGKAIGADEAASGHIGVWKRLGASRTKIVELRGPSVPHVVEGNPSIRGDIAARMTEQMKKRVAYEIGRVLERIKKK